MDIKSRILLFFLFCAVSSLRTQTTLHFNKLTVEHGLNDGAVQAICHDGMGFMWFSTIGGINRFNGSKFRFFNRVESDTGVVPISICRSIALDSAGRLFFGFENGLATFDNEKQTLRMVAAVGNRWVLNMFATSDSAIYLSTYEGLLCYNPNTGQLNDLPQQDWFGTIHGRIKGWTIVQDTVWLLTQAGLFQMLPSAKDLKKVSLPKGINEKEITHIEADGQGKIWLGIASQNLLVKLSDNLSEYVKYPLQTLMDEWSVTRIVSSPRHPYLWVATNSNGLLQWNPVEEKFIKHENNPLQPWTSNTNLVRALHIDRNGLVWFGGDYGINYTNPNRSLFKIIPSFGKETTQRSRRIARVATEDNEGNLWFGTLDGVVQFQKTTGAYKEFNNRPGQQDAIHANSVRGVHATSDNKIWIATARGINRYDLKNGKMDFFDERDSIITGFFFAINEDREGAIWFSSRDGDGLYYLKPGAHKFSSIRNHEVLRQWVNRGFRYVYHDTKGRYWMGFNGQGLGMYDPGKEIVETWNSVKQHHDPIAGNYIVDIKEDKTGYIWVSTFNGLSCINPNDFSVANYTTENGLLSNTVAALGIDSLNRVWIATSRGLLMLDENRQYFTNFGLADGLPSVSFPEHACFQAKNGDLIMGTLNGYIRFNPLHFKTVNGKLPCFIGEITISNRDSKLINTIQEPLNLSYYENALQLQLVGVNYDNPAQTWYAYKLDGFEDIWHYTQDPKAVYTNLPGGTYRFLYKAGTNAKRWHGEENVMEIRVGTIFYKSSWFWLLCALLLTGGLYWLYQMRIAQQQRVFILESKAQKLEKEKTQVMYENLKQHLNPHFLFNSLTSLSSLIRTDQNMAGDFLDRMSKIYRYILKNRDSETVTLEEEIKFVTHFIELQKARFESGLQVEINIPQEYLDKEIAPVTLQNLVENAIKHNTTSKQKPLKISLLIEEDYLVVKNNLQRKAFVETSNQTGLKSMQDLYNFLSDRPMIVEEDAECFVVKIPLL